MTVNLLRCDAMGDVDLGRVSQCLVNDTVPFGQTKKRGDLFFGRVSIQLEMQADLVETNRDFFGNGQSSPEIEIALGAKGRVAQRNVERGSDRAQSDSSA